VTHEAGTLDPAGVESMFDRIAPVYDVMNRVMTAGLDQRWRRRAVEASVRRGDRVLDACCGTGEFWSLGLAEYEACVRVAVEETAGRVPVIAGTGYGLGLATEFAAAARRAGADGLLAMPPYLVAGGQAGLGEHYRQLADAADLDIIIYQRDNAVFTPETVAVTPQVRIAPAAISKRLSPMRTR